MNHAERFNREMVAIARSLREMTQGELATAAGTTQARISKVEHGLITPPSELVAAMAKALNVPDQFFFQPGHFYSLPIRYHRKRASVSKKALDRVHAEISVRVLNIAAFLKSAEIQSEYTVPEIDMDERELSPEDVARHVRHLWQVPRGPIPNLIALLERVGVVVVPCDFGTAEVDAVGMRPPGMPPLMFVNSRMTTDRLRFTVAHELCHLIAHAIPSEAMEDEAQRFAAELLMPEADIRPQLRGVTLPMLATLKRVWRVSMSAILERARRLKVIAEDAYLRLRKVLASNGWTRREPAELDIAPEVPSSLEALIRFHRENLGFGIAQLAQVTHWFPDDFRVRYMPSSVGLLRLVG